MSFEGWKAAVCTSDALATVAFSLSRLYHTLRVVPTSVARYVRFTFIALLLVGLARGSAANAQVLEAGTIDTSASDSITNAPPEKGKAANLSDISRMSPREFNLSLVILVFGGLVLLAEVAMLRHMKCSPEELLRVFGITLIVMGTLLIVPAGFSSQSIAPAMGLLGTVAGYLLSQRSDKRKPPGTGEPGGQ